MLALHHEFVIDDKGKKRSVLLPYEEWVKIVEELEELDDIRSFDKSKADKTETIPFEKALKELNLE